MDKVYEEKRAKLQDWTEWPMEVNDFAMLMGVNRRFVIRALVDRGMVKMYERKDGTQIPGLYGAFITEKYGLEIWEWLYAHLERRAYDKESKSRRIAGKPACSWLPRWVPPAGRGEELPPEIAQHFAEDRRYRGKEIAEWLGVSVYKVSRTATRLKYRGGWYILEEARRVAHTILRDTARLEVHSATGSTIGPE